MTEWVSDGRLFGVGVVSVVSWLPELSWSVFSGLMAVWSSHRQAEGREGLHARVAALWSLSPQGIEPGFWERDTVRTPERPRATVSSSGAAP